MKAFHFKTALCMAALIAAASAQAGCYIVTDAKGNVVSQTQTPPVDMSYQLHQTVPYRYGKGATMTFSQSDANCGPVIDQYYNLKPENAGYYKRYGGAPKAAARPAARRRKARRHHLRRARPAAARATQAPAATAPATPASGT